MLAFANSVRSYVILGYDNNVTLNIFCVVFHNGVTYKKDHIMDPPGHNKVEGRKVRVGCSQLYLTVCRVRSFRAEIH